MTSLYKAAQGYGWLLAILVSVLSVAVVYTRPISAIPATVERKTLAPTTPGGIVHLEVCTKATSVTAIPDPIINATRYTAVGPSILLWPDNDSNTLALLNDEPAEITKEVADCLRQRAKEHSRASPLMPSPAMAASAGDYFPISRSYFPRELAMEQQGTWPWRYTQTSTGDLLPAIVGAFDDTSIRYGVFFQYDSINGQDNRSATSAEVIAACTSTFAAACVGYDPPYYPLSCNAIYNGPYMATFYTQSQRAVVYHELQHCQTRRNEAYDTATMSCIPADTIMGCGPQSPKFYTAHDDAAWAEEHYPGPVSWVFISPEWKAVFYGPMLANSISNSKPATRVALVACDPARGCYWTGYWGATTYNATIDAMPLPSLAGIEVCYWVKTENEISWRFSESTTFAGCIQ